MHLKRCECVQRHSRESDTDGEGLPPRRESAAKPGCPGETIVEESDRLHKVYRRVEGVGPTQADIEMARAMVGVVVV